MAKSTKSRRADKPQKPYRRAAQRLVLPRLVKSRWRFQAFSRKAAAIILVFRLLSQFITKFLTPARACGAVPVLTRQRSSPNVSSRTQCT